MHIEHIHRHHFRKNWDLANQYHPSNERMRRAMGRPEIAETFVAPAFFPHQLAGRTTQPGKSPAFLLSIRKK